MKRGRLVLELLPGFLFLLAGLRDFLLPGFLCISSRPDTDGTVEVCVGLAWLVVVFAKWRRGVRSRARAAQTGAVADRSSGGTTWR
jgi:hypothetical protein